MKLHLADTRNRNTLTGYGPGYLTVNGNRHETALIVTPDAPPQPWPVGTVADITAETAGLLLSAAPEIIIIGTGPAQVFPSPEQLRPLIEARIGLEIMNSPAACRTYNVLMGEGRRVTAAICLP